MEKKLKRWTGAIVTVWALVSIGSLGFAEEKKPSNSIVAVVNGTVIAKEDFSRAVSRVQMQAVKRGTNLNDSMLVEIKKRVLEDLISRELLYQESQKKGIKISEKEVDEKLMDIKKRLPNQASFESALKSINFSEATFKTFIRRGMAIEKFIGEQFGKEVEIADKETRSYYENNLNLFKKPEQVRASHILIKVEPQASESQRAEAQKKLEKIQEKMQNGEDFASLAKEFSQGPSNVKGGDLGYFRRGQMVKPFQDAAFALKPGEVSGIVKTRFGYHLIKVVDKKQEGTIPYVEVKDRIAQYLKREKIQKRMGLYVEKLKENAKVERFLTKGS
jgi:peptidyl-prolyl cis-trans isomerase C